MPTIDVSQNVLRQLRALRKSGEKTENDVLERLLHDLSSARERALREYEKADQDIRSTN